MIAVVVLMRQNDGFSSLIFWSSISTRYWSAHKIPDSVKANMKKAQQKRGKAVRAVAPDGSWKDYNTMLDAVTEHGMNAGSIANNLKSKGVCNNGYRFKTTVPNFPRP